ncbi:MAG: class I SAM-dependent methyltransferase [Rhodoferax sp.]|nr:class I SAM-dependent methyltransferase [Rhodoferax sp.]
MRLLLQRWPLPAILSWGAAWAVFRLAQGQGAPITVAMGAAAALGVLLSLWGDSWWRRVLIALGFPLSLALTQSTEGLTTWVWLLPLGVLLLVYPVNAWRDAPLFPTPRYALDTLSHYAALPAGARVLDAGCGLGHGLAALRRAYPQASLHGLEWSWLLRCLCALRCPWAHIRHEDIWKADWSGYALVYLFQRPESMQRAADKARAELRPGAWLVSLEFEATSLQVYAHFKAADGKMVWLYQAPLMPLAPSIPPIAFQGD